MVMVVGLNSWLGWFRIGTVNVIKTVVVGVAGLAVFCGAIRLRLLLYLLVLPCILCCAVGFGLGILIQCYDLFK